MIKKLIFAFVLMSVYAAINASSAGAAAFNPGRIVDDIVFTNHTSMTVTQIQNFLNSKVGSCDTYGTRPASDFGRPDITRAQYAAIKGWHAPPYTCLRDYVENGRSSAQIIYDISRQYTINPQVFIVLLQKETGLVTDTWPLAWQYRTATGYGCPDSTPGVCNANYFGFTNQVTWAAKLFRSVLNQSPTWYSPYVKGWNYIQWSPTASCGGSMVYVENWSTAALYDYTPYQPNQAALNAGYGAGDSCSAYGNRNFYLYFTDWFGPTTRNLITTTTGGVYQVENGVKRAFPDEITFLSHGYSWSEILSIGTSEFDQMSYGDPMPYNVNYRNGQLISTDGNSIYLMVDGKKRNIPSETIFLSYSWKWSDVRTLSALEFGFIPAGDPMPRNPSR